MHRFLAVSMLLAVTAATFAGPAVSQQQSNELKATQAAPLQPRTVRMVIRPTSIDHDIQVDITAPPATPAPGDKLPAIYVLDGGYDLMGPSAGFIMSGGQMASAYVISIGYPNPRGSSLGDRNNDLSHVRAPFVPEGPVYGGGGAAFEAFILNELRPLLESRLPLDPNRAVLFGHSLGGTFAATILVHKPDAFAGYLIASPALNRDPSILDQARMIASNGGGRRVYVSYTPEDVRLFSSQGLGAALSGPGSKFVVREKVFEDEGHRSSYLRLAQDAFPFLLPPPPPAPPQVRPTAITVDQAALSRYAGDYRFPSGSVMTISLEGGSLFARSSGQPKYELSAESQLRFFFRERGINARISFVVDQTAKATGLVLSQNGTDQMAARID